MNIFEYVKNIKKRFTKTDVNSAIDSISAELTNVTIPLFAEKAAWLAKGDDDLLCEFYRNDRDGIMNDFAKSGYLRKSNPFAMVLQSLRNSAELLTYVKGFLEKQQGDDLSGESITISTSNALQLVDIVAFASTYSRAWMDVVLCAESNSRNNLAEQLDLTQAQIVYLGDNRANFGIAISILATPVEKVEKLFAEIPEVVISETNPKSITGTLGQDRVDPLRLNLVQSKWDPIYLIGMIRTDYNASRYKAAKEEAMFLELRIARLKKQMQQKDDPHLAMVIERRKGQLDTIRGKLLKMENSVS